MAAIDVVLVSRGAPELAVSSIQGMLDGYLWWDIVVDRTGEVVTWVGAGPAGPGTVAVGLGVRGNHSKVFTDEGPPYTGVLVGFLERRGYRWAEGVRKVLCLEGSG